MSFPQTNYWQLDYPTRMPKGYPGMLVGLGHPEVDSYANSADDKAQVTAIAVGTATNNTDYNLIFDGTQVTIRSDATATATEIRDALITAINRSAIYNKAVASVVDAATLKIAARSQYAGYEFVVLVSGGGTSYAVDTNTSTPPSVSEDIGFGLVVVRASGDKDGVARLPSGAGQKVLGITIGDLTDEQRNTESAYRRNKMMSVWRSGPPDIMVYIEADVTMDGAPYYRHTPNGNLNVRGAVRANADSGCLLLPGYRFKSSGKAGTYAILGKE